MPTVTLSQEWTDLQGVTHEAGTALPVDDVTAARLQADGYVEALGGGQADGAADDHRTRKSPSARGEEWKSPSAREQREPETQEEPEQPGRPEHTPQDGPVGDGTVPGTETGKSPSPSAHRELWKSPSRNP